MPGRFYQFASDASFASLDARAASDSVEVVWRLGRRARLSMDLTGRMVEGLRSLPTAFDAATFRRSLGDDHAADSGAPAPEEARARRSARWT